MYYGLLWPIIISSSERVHKAQRDVFFRNVNPYNRLPYPHPQKKHLLRITDGREYNLSHTNKNAPMPPLPSWPRVLPEYDIHQSGITPEILLATKNSLKPTSIPIPPALPLKPLTKANHKIYTPVNAEQLQETKNKLKPFNPFSKYDPLTKADLNNSKKPLNSVANDKPYETRIHSKSKTSDFTDASLVEELRVRGLVKKDDGGSACNVLDKDNKEHALGASDHNVRLTPIGQAYLKQAPTTQPSTLDFPPPKIPQDIGHDVTIGFANIDTLHMFMKSGEQKHLLLLQPLNNDGYASPLYFTSKAAAEIIAYQQYRVHQIHMENINHNTKIKIPDNWKGPQKSVKFNDMKIFKKNEITIVKWDKSYIKTQVNIKKVGLAWKELFNKPYVPYNPSGITKQRILEMCQAYDFIVFKKYIHPKTYDDELNQIKNKPKNKNSTQKSDDAQDE